MALSEYERKMLEELEAQLSDEDPGFADTLKPAAPRVSASKQMSIKHLVLGLLVVILGIGVLIVGVATELVIVGVLGFVVMFGGAWYVTEGIVDRPDGQDGQSDEGGKPRQPKTPRKRRSLSDFMTEQAQEWERRRREGGGR